MSQSTIKQHLTLTPNDPKRLDALRGDNDSHLKAIEQRFNIQIFVDDNHFELIGLPKSIRQAGALPQNCMSKQSFLVPSVTRTFIPLHIVRTSLCQQPHAPLILI